MDQRSSKRLRTFLNGRIVFNNRFSIIDCAVRDLSTTGCRIAFSHPITIPAEFEIEIPKKELSARARVMWSNGKEHGVMFVEAPQGSAFGNAPVMATETQPQDDSVPEQAVPDAAEIQEILDEAQRRIAEITGRPVEKVRLKLEFDFLRAGVRKQ